MNSKQRIAAAMALGTPDRVPVMSQLSLGHYFLHSGLQPLDIWYRSDVFAEALIRMSRRYRFDGILVNLPGRDPAFDTKIDKLEKGEGETIVRWKSGGYTVVPADDNAHYYRADGTRFFPTFEEIDPEALYYVEPWDITGISYPYTWDFETEPRPFTDYFPPYHLDAIRQVKGRVGEAVSVHSEVFSPWSQLLELLNYESALLAILDDPGKVKACLERLTEGAIELARRQAACGVDAILISSAFAGAGLISRVHYETFVSPYEKAIATTVQRECAVPVYTHTCGSIGDRLDLMLATGTKGIDTLDPPPLGTVDLAEAKALLQGKAFIKGNVDPVHTLLNGNLETVRNDVRWRIGVGKPGGGYILSSACSIAPHTPPENIEQLALLAEQEGRYAP